MDIEEAKARLKFYVEHYDDFMSKVFKTVLSELEKKDIIIKHLINDLYDLAVAVNEEYRVEEYLLNKETIKEYYSKRKEE